MLAIYKREMRGYFTTWTGYIFLAVAICLSAFIFSISTLLNSTSELSGYFSIIVYGMVVFLPILTMKSFSEEKKLKTEQLLMTAPISSWQMVLGKYLSALTMLGIYLISTLIFFIPLFDYAVVDVVNGYGPNVALMIGNMLAMMLIGACFIAVGIFISSLTENQFASIVLTIVVLLAFLLIGSFNSLIENESVRVVLDWFSLYSRYQSFTYGMFDISALLYYISVAGIFVFLTTRVFEARRYN
ncbi:MAG: ABC transporter permease subunit [Clostridia bacterium]|nr:ABC transporter permease subunit [Clostridia bacterium]